MKELLINFWKSAGKKIRILSEDERKVLWNLVKEKYLRHGAHVGYSICDALNYPLCSSSRGTDSWRCIGDFIKNNTVILFFNKDWGDDFYEIENGRMFVDFYSEECGGIEFYMTDLDANFLFAYNQAQCIVAMGTAREWLSSYKNMLESYIVNFKNSVNKFKELQREKYPAVTEENDNGEWEPGHIEFDDMCGAYLKLIENIDYDNDKNNLLDDMLYAIARDNECEFLIGETLEHPDWFSTLCKSCISSEYNNAKWQFASYLPDYHGKTDIKGLIFDFLNCKDEYTERMALRSLAEIEPDSVEKYAEIFWNRNKYEADEYQKMMVLEVLEKIKSSKLNEYIAKALKMNYEYLRKQADDIKNRLQ